MEVVHCLYESLDPLSAKKSLQSESEFMPARLAFRFLNFSISPTGTCFHVELYYTSGTKGLTVQVFL